MRAVARHCRQIEMGICARVAVAGEMLRRGEAAIFFYAAHESSDKLGYARGVFTERTRVYDGVSGVTVDVCVGCENPGNAGSFRFERRNLAHRVCVFGP